MLPSLFDDTAKIEAFAALGSFAAAALALVVASVSIYYAVRGLSLQRDHNRLSVIPVPFLALADYENCIRVKVRNDGIGPLLVDKIDIVRGEVANEIEELVSYMPKLPAGIYWRNFSSGYVRSVRPGDELILLELEGDDANAAFHRFRDKCRKALSGLIVTVRYTNIYGDSFDPHTRDLSWFGRRLASSRRSPKAV